MFFFLFLKVDTTASKYAECMALGGDIQIFFLPLQPSNLPTTSSLRLSWKEQLPCSVPLPSEHPRIIPCWPESQSYPVYLLDLRNPIGISDPLMPILQ